MSWPPGVTWIRHYAEAMNITAYVAGSRVRSSRWHRDTVVRFSSVDSSLFQFHTGLSHTADSWWSCCGVRAAGASMSVDSRLHWHRSRRARLRRWRPAHPSGRCHRRQWPTSSCRLQPQPLRITVKSSRGVARSLHWKLGPLRVSSMVRDDLELGLNVHVGIN